MTTKKIIGDGLEKERKEKKRKERKERKVMRKRNHFPKVASFSYFLPFVYCLRLSAQPWSRSRSRIIALSFSFSPDSVSCWLMAARIDAFLDGLLDGGGE